MTPAQVARAAMRLADALDVIADEMRREDPCQEIITAHAGSAGELARALDAALPTAPIRDAEPCVIMHAMMYDAEQGRFTPTSGLLSGWADAWRSWGEGRQEDAAEDEREARTLEREFLDHTAPENEQ